MSTLVIVESPAKAHTVGRILGPDYKVMASVGHIRDLPEHQEGIKREELPDGRMRFTPTYVVPPEKEKVVAGLASAARQADEILLASDPDREGEAIAWHLREELRSRLGARCDRPFRRIEYHEITPRAVRAALAAPHDIDQRRVDAQQARRCIDRYLGFRLSPRVARAVRGGSSAGRVQSVALRLVCDREREVSAFVPTPYWEFSVLLARESAPDAPFAVRLRKLDGARAEVRDEALAARVEAFLGAAAYAVRDIVPKQVQKRPGPPFTTSTLQQAASNALGFAPDRTMRLAQDLYESGLITYMRTDSTNIAPEAREAAARYIEGSYGKEFADPHNYATRSKTAQGAHECIRPTDPAAAPDAVAAGLPAGRDAADLARLYRLVWERFVSSQMAPAVSEVSTATVDASAPAPAGAPASAELTASASRLLFPGFLALRGAAAVARADAADAEGASDEADDALAALPPLVPGEALRRDAVRPERKETRPPPRFNEASLVREMEARGIGRPSTYASIIKTLKDRRYVRSERRVLSPTPLGGQVCDWLVAKFPDFMDVGYTAEMEERLDRSQDPGTPGDWQDLLSDFYRQFLGWLEGAKEWAPTSAVADLLDAFRSVRDWQPPRKLGARTYDDLKFVQDLAYDVMREPRPRARDRRPDKPYRFERPAGELPAGIVTRPQFEALGRTLLRYRDQVPGADGILRAAGLGSLLEAAAPSPSGDRTAALVEALSKYGPAPDDERFFRSLESQLASGRRLSPRQEPWVARLFLNARDRIPAAEFEALRTRFGIEDAPGERVDRDRAEAVVSALAAVTAWAEPAARRKGGRVFDDKSFYASVAAQFGTRGAITPPQLAALERMLLRYRDQIPGADAIAERYGIRPAARRASARPRKGTRE